MKIGFLLQRRFAMIGHAMACQIKELNPDTEFCALVHGRIGLEFINAQKEIKYTSVLFDEDIHRSLYAEEVDMDYLRMIEKEYGIPNLWPYLYIDRIIMNGQLLREYPHDQPTLSYKEMLQCIQVNAREIIAFLETEKPDAIVFSVIGSVTSTLLYHIAKKKGIQTVNIEFARIGNRIVFSEDDMTFTWVRDRFNQLQSGSKSDRMEEAETFLAKFRENPVPYDYEKLSEYYKPKGPFSVFEFLVPKKLAKSIPWHLKTLWKDIGKRKNRDYTDIFLWWSLWDKLMRKCRMLFTYSGLYTKPDWNADFAYYPFHTDPEIATMRYAPYHTNQQEVIRAVARALPVGMLLYIKEHPSMVGFRTRAYYDDLLRIPNVRLIDPGVSSNQLSVHAAITTTITSTAGWEALLSRKPALTFGNTFYNDIPGVKFCRAYDDLPYMIEELLTKWKSDDGILLNYICALLEDSVSVDFSYMWNEAVAFDTILKDEGMRSLSLLLAQKIQVIKTT